ncbi:MAG: hypothetical protein WCA20_13465 [Candidatus Sulfotelmatobacter sp.]
MAHGMQKDWRELCIAVTNETDSTKRASLVQELIEALDKGERGWRSHHSPVSVNHGESGSRLGATAAAAD